MAILRYPISLLLLSATQLSAETTQPILDTKHRIFFEENCVKCHNDKKQKGKVRLDDISFNVDSLKQADLWQKILDAVNSGDMPPEDEDQPSSESKANFLEDLSNTMVAARLHLTDSGGNIVMRRLNRREYQNTIHDLLGVEMDVSNLPPDEGSGNFDTVGSSLFMSSDQIEQYMIIGRKALDENLARTTALSGTSTKSFHVQRESEVGISDGMKKEAAKLKQEHDRLADWMAAVNPKISKDPKLAEKIKKISGVTGLRGNTALEGFYTSWLEDGGTPKPQDFKIKNLGGAFKSKDVYDLEYLSLVHTLNLPQTDKGRYLRTYFRDADLEIIRAPKDWPPGKYKLSLRIAAADKAPAERRFIEVGLESVEPDKPIADESKSGRAENTFNFKTISAHQVTGILAKPQTIEVLVDVPKTGSRKFMVGEKRRRDVEEAKGTHSRAVKNDGMGPKPSIWIDWIRLEGPVQQSAGEAKVEPVFFAKESSMSERSHAALVINKFAGRAFRGKEPEVDYLYKLLALYEVSRKSGQSHENALKETLSVILASPGFLYLQEIGEMNVTVQTNTRIPISLSNFELANRLSYFLWSAPPDEQLIKADLSKPDVLALEVDRMIASKKSDDFVSGFVHQWLGMERLDFFQFNNKQFPDFDDSAKAAARGEVYATFAHLMRNNKSLNKLLKSNEIHVNGLLATYYGIDGVTGSDFQKVTLPAKSPRGGLLGMAAIHAMGSDGERSSPVERGAWVLRHLLNDPPPPAPPNVPQLSRLADKPLSPREKLAAHQEEPQCASCHRKIDPIGFGLENFNAAGKWREVDVELIPGSKKKEAIKREWPIEPAGKIHNGPSFADYFELRDYISGRSNDFAQGFTEGLIEYGLGRSYAFTDGNLSDEIIKQSKAKGFGVREFIHALVRSKQFKMK